MIFPDSRCSSLILHDFPICRICYLIDSIGAFGRSLIRLGFLEIYQGVVSSHSVKAKRPLRLRSGQALRFRGCAFLKQLSISILPNSEKLPALGKWLDSGELGSRGVDKA